MIELERLRARFGAAGLADWADRLGRDIPARISPQTHGDLPRWQAALDALPEARAGRVELDRPAPRIGPPEALDGAARTRLREALLALHPWRKGPFDLFGVTIDAEWRSDLKWARLAPHIRSLAGRRVLDIGSGNGYYLLRMLGAGAELAIGMDPMLIFLMQFLGVRKYLDDDRAWVLPLGVEALPPGLAAFDTVFSMGVLYHRRSPLDHLAQLHDALAPGGELVLETLVIPGGRGQVLVPGARYARMRNVWFIPSIPELEAWLARIGFTEIRTIDQTPTTTAEQRSTEWMRFESLDKALDARDPSRTVEGHPRPLRALLLARRRGED